MELAYHVSGGIMGTYAGIHYYSLYKETGGYEIELSREQRGYYFVLYPLSKPKLKNLSSPRNSVIMMKSSVIKVDVPMA